MSQYSWHYPTEIIAGAKVTRQLHEHASRLGFKKPLWVTDGQLFSTPMFQGIATTLKLSIEDIYSDVGTSPCELDVMGGVAQYKDGGYDGIVAIGGGCALDVAKAIAFMSAQSQSIWAFEDVGTNYLQANSQFPKVICVPTTAGTGSEVGRSSVITNTETKEKKIIFHPNMMPSLVLLDPTLCVGLPKSVTAATGMDALAHCMEAYFSHGYHPMADGIALEGLRLIKENLLRAYECPDDLQARLHMLTAATMGATAFQKGLGAVHALSHTLGGQYGWHHGLLNAILMPYVLRLNGPVIAERAYVLSQYLQCEEDGVDGLILWAQSLSRKMGLPDSLAHFGVAQWDYDWIVSTSLSDPTAPSNPTKLDERSMMALLKSAIVGDFSAIDEVVYAP